MGYKFVDTNIFIEIFARDGVKSERSNELIQKEDDLYTTTLVISEFEWVLRTVYLLNRKKISIYVKRILTSDIEVDNKQILLETVNFYEKNNVDWTDCLNMFLLKDESVSVVYSYDKGLNKFDWVKRIEP